MSGPIDPLSASRATLEILQADALNTTPNPQTLLQRLKTSIGLGPTGDGTALDLGPISVSDPLEKIGIQAAGASGLFDQRAWMEKVIAFSEKHLVKSDGAPVSLVLSLANQAPDLLTPAVSRLAEDAKETEFVSLCPTDYRTIEDFLTGTGMAVDFDTVSEPNLVALCPMQIAHLLNVIYVRTALRFKATALGEFKLARNQVASPTRFEAVFELAGHPGLTQAVNLEGAHLFSLSRWIDTTMESAWSLAFDEETDRCLTAFADEVTTLFGQMPPPLEPETFGSFKIQDFMRMALTSTSALVRLRMGSKAHVNIQAVNEKMREFNSQLDREVLSLAVRFGPRNSLTSTTYEFFARPDVRQALAHGALKGAFAPLTLPDELLREVYSMPVECAGPYKAYLKEIERSCSPALHEALSQQSPSYFLRFPRNRPFFLLADGPMTSHLDGYLQAGYADPIEAAQIMAAALGRQIADHGVNSLPPGELLVTNGTVMQFLGGTKLSAQYGISEVVKAVGISIAQRVHGLSMLMSEVAIMRRRPKATIQSAIGAVSTRESDYLDAPSLEALLALRNPRVKNTFRSRALALRSALDLAAPVTTKVSTAGRTNALDWELMLIDIVPPEEAPIYGNWKDTNVSAAGTVYQLSFRSRKPAEQWIHLRFSALRCENEGGDVFLRTRHLHEDSVPLHHITDPSPTHGTLTIADSAPGVDGKDKFDAVVDLASNPRDPNRRVFHNLAYSALSNVKVPVMIRRAGHERKVVEASLVEHSESLCATVLARIRELSKADPASFAALFSNDKYSVMDMPAFSGGMPSRIGNQKSLRLAAIASSVDTRVIEEVAARMANPFTTTRSGGSIVDVCEHVQSSLNSDRADLTPLQAVLRGLARNPACIADQECFTALLERSMLKCLEKEPKLLTEFLKLGAKPNEDVLNLLPLLHPKRVNAELKAVWTAALMSAQIDKTRVEIESSHAAAAMIDRVTARRPRVSL